MKSIFQDQAEFMLAGDQTVGEYNGEQIDLYEVLIDEEVTEFFMAETIENRVKEAEDILVVVSGWLHSVGVDADEAWRRVHASNMSKLIDGKLVKREDGKILKPDTYRAPVLSDLVSHVP